MHFAAGILIGFYSMAVLREMFGDYEIRLMNIVDKFVIIGLAFFAFGATSS